MYAASTNLVRICVDLFTAVADTQLCIFGFGAAERVLVRSLLLFFSEMCQGPCLGNQLLLARSDAVTCINAVIQIDNDLEEAERARDPRYVDTKFVGAIVLAAVVEGSPDGEAAFEVR